MGFLFGGSKSVHTSAPVISSMRLQTSAYGAPVPLMYGRTRLATNLIWYNDFKAIPHTESQGGGGKGGGGGESTSTTYTYQVACIMGLCEGPVQSVPLVYIGKNKKLPEEIGLSVYLGTTSQTPFGYVVSTHPEEALAYSGLAYLAASIYDLGESANFENHNFEVVSDPSFRVSGVGRSIAKVIVAQGPEETCRVTSALLQYSDNGTSWTTISTLTLPNDDASHTFTFTATANHRYYRLLANSDLRKYKGTYAAGTQYYAGEVVKYGGTYWIAYTDAKGVTPAAGYYSETVEQIINGEVYVGEVVTKTYTGSWVEAAPYDLRWSVAQFDLYADTDPKSKPISSQDRGTGTYFAPYVPRYAFDTNKNGTVKYSTYWRSDERAEAVNGAASIGQDFGLWDCDPALVLEDFLTHSRYGAGFPASMIGDWTNFSNYCIANNLLISPSYTQQKAAQEMLSEVTEVCNSGLLFSEGLLKIIPFGDSAVTGNGVTYTPDLTPQYNLTDNDFLAEADEEPIRVIRSSPADAYNHVQLKYYNRAADYAVEPVEAKDQADIELNGLRTKDPVEYNFICEASIAGQAVHLMLQRDLFIRNTYEFRLSWAYSRLEPGDLVTLTDSELGLSNTLVRITEVEEDEEGTLTIRARDMLVGVGSSPVYETDRDLPQVFDYNVIPGPVVEPVFFNGPGNLTVTGYELWMAAAGLSEFWGGCQVWASYDGTSYKQIGTVFGKSRFGTLISTLDSSTDPDSTNTLQVDLTQCGGAELLSATQAEVDAFATLCMVDSELIAYRDATLVSTNNYDLDYLRRGVYGSIPLQHITGSQFIRLDSAIFKYAYNPDDFGKTIWIKLCSFNIYGQNVENLADVQAYQTVLGSASAYPPDVTGFAAAQNGNTVLFQWDLLENASVNGFEIRFNSKGVLTWDDATPVTRVTRGTQITTVKVPPGDWTFLIAARDRSGQYSQNKASYDLEVSNSNQVVFQREESEYWELGTKTNMVIHPSTRKLVPESQGDAQDHGWNTFNDFCPNPYASYSYEVPVIDLTVNVKVRVYALVSSALGQGEQGLADPEVYFDYKPDGGAYKGYTQWGIGTFNARYIKQKIEVLPSRGLCYISSFKPSADAEIRVEKHAGVYISEAGTTITFDTPFYFQPSVSVTAVSGTAVYAQVVAQSKQDVTVKVFNISGTAIPGTANIEAAGV